MNDQKQPRESRPETKPGKSGEGSGPSTKTKVPPAGEVAPSKKLTAEEQMAQYEDDLKENDWGHQPC